MGALSLRYFSVYGPRMDLEGAYATVIGAFMRARREGRPLEIRGDGEQRRDFTHVRDVVRANLAAMDCALEDGSAINVGRGEALSVNRIAELIGGPRVNVAPRPGEPRDTLADLARSRAILGWSPEVETEDGVRELMRLHGLSPPAVILSESCASRRMSGILGVIRHRPQRVWMKYRRGLRSRCQKKRGEV